MKKKLYEKPTSKVYELKQQPQLLAGSGPNATSATMEDEFVIEDWTI